MNFYLLSRELWITDKNRFKKKKSNIQRTLCVLESVMLLKLRLQRKPSTPAAGSLAHIAQYKPILILSSSVIGCVVAPCGTPFGVPLERRAKI